MKSQKFIAVCAAVSLLLPFAACKKQLPASATKTQQTNSTKSEGESNLADEKLVPENGAKLKFRSSDTAFAKAIAAKFKEKYGIEVVTQEGGAYDFSKGVLEGASGKGPDVFMSPHDKTLEGIQAGLFLELNPQMVKKLQNEVSKVAMKTVTVNNKVYGVPVSIETNVLFYNKALVKGKPASTYKQIEEEAKSYNNPSKNKFWFLTDVTAGSPIYPMLSTYGFNLFGPNGTDENKPGFDTPEFKKGLEVLRKYHDIMPISSGDLANADFLTNQFVTGKTAYIVGGPWNVKTFRDAKVDFGVTSLPSYDGHEERPFAFVQNANVSAYTKYPKAAQIFAEFLVSPECAELLYTKASKITSRSDISDVKGLNSDEQLIAIAKAFNKAFPMPSAKRISYYWTISANIGPAVFDGKMAPAQGAEKAVKDWNTFLKTEG